MDLTFPHTSKTNEVIQSEVGVDINKPYWLNYKDIAEIEFKSLINISKIEGLDLLELNTFFGSTISDYNPQNLVIHYIVGDVHPHIDQGSGGNSILIPIKTSDRCIVYTENDSIIPTTGKPFLLETHIRHGAKCPKNIPIIFISYLGRNSKILSDI